MSRDFLFTSESVSEGHPDKMSDQVEVQYDNSGKTTIQISGSPVHRRKRHFEPSSDAHDVRARQSRQVRHMSNIFLAKQTQR